MANKPIFFDATGRRAARVTVVGWTIAILSSVLGIVFVATLFAAPQMANLRLPGQLTAINLTDLEFHAKDPARLKSAVKAGNKALAQREEQARIWRERAAQRNATNALKPPKGRPWTMVFYGNWGDASANFADLERELPKVDWVLPTWLNFGGDDLTLKTSFDSNLVAYVRGTKPSVAILPTLQNASGGQFDGPGLAKIVGEPKQRAILLDAVTNYVGQHKLDGIVVDFEEVPDDAHDNVELFLHALRTRFAQHKWVVAMAAPFDDDKWPYAAYAKLVDYTILMAYDQHDNSEEPGSLAGQSWFESVLDKRMKVLAPDRTVIGIGSYTYDWNGGPADSPTYMEAMVAAHDAGATVVFDDITNNPHFSYTSDDDHTRHDVWFLDGVTAFNQIHAADVYQPAGYALWRMGTEDPSIWSVFGRTYGAAVPQGLKQIANEDIDYEGEGEIIRVEVNPGGTGTRRMEIDPQTGDIDDETYTRLPTAHYVIHQFGAAGHDHDVALTFDDGPDPQWTPQILDILKAKHVPATFFVIGVNAQSNPSLIQRILAEGHELGNHTFTHPNLSDTPLQASALELNATQRLVEALTGRSLRLFRPPYLGDAEPTDDDEIVPVKQAQDMGYVTVGEHVDPVDWQLPGTPAIVKSVIDQVNHRTPGTKGIPTNIVLLHDAGGDRSQTVAALPMIIDRLRAEGYHFVPVSDLTNLTRDQAMPQIGSTFSLMMDRIVFLTLNALGNGLYICFLIAIWLGILRLLVLAGLSVVNRWRNGQRELSPPATGQSFLVSVLVPAYNEARVIASTVRTILASDHEKLEVIVIDDGSLDDTAGVVRNEFGNDPRVELIRIANGGKANALNVGIAQAKGDIIVALDADTQFAPTTISRLVRWFVDPEVGAVAGNAKVGNRVNTITRWQALEYIVAQNLERRALAALGTLTVVPGAVGAWRKAALLEVGGYPSDTLAEDQDLTIHLQSKGYSVRFDSTAVAWTEAPNSFAGLARQRFRWAYGTLQCLWKYRNITFNPRYGALGMIALPQVWLFQILLTALAPFADLLLIWQLIGQGIAYLQHGAEFTNDNLVVVGIYYAVFMVVDLTAALIGFLMERGENWSLLWWLVLQRFGYRQLMYYVVVRSIWTALKGPFVGWGKLERTGMVRAGQA
jgi:cellulose synthase/poly-beta-1,6-N-acetylglucosamine synthase-like glycosyltransferase/peptidoglycan/xylan/chitin deacetylase (PgdA/CDA1 family)/spore germination protein YaaH